MPSPVKIIVGLGNTGKNYEKTRHNVGFMVLDRLAQRWNTGFTLDKYRKGELAPAPGVLLVKPTTMMNESGMCVGPLMRFFKMSPENILVICDEVAFALGTIKLREKGSAGGHNGIKSLIAHLGSQDFPRVRCGIGAPAQHGGMTGHVLGKFSPVEQPILDRMIEQAADAVQYALQYGMERAGNIYNTKHNCSDQAAQD